MRSLHKQEREFVRNGSRIKLTERMALTLLGNGLLLAGAVKVNNDWRLTICCW